jgi:hypothetical protein
MTPKIDFVKVAGKFFNPEAVEVLYKYFPEHSTRFPKRQPNFKRPAMFDVDSSKVKKQLLERDFIPFEKVIMDTAKKLFELEQENLSRPEWMI